jgi:predicted nucleic acid-binding Zn ribbon protein
MSGSAGPIHRWQRHHQLREHAACRRAGVDVTVLNRGNDRREVPHEVEQPAADIRDPRTVLDVIRGRTFDVVVDWVA